MKILLVFLVILGQCVYNSGVEEEVYICVSKNAVAYHKSKNQCRGLGKCTHDIIKVTKEDAIRKYKYRACKICYK